MSCYLFLLTWEMQFWCPAPLPTSEEPRQKLSSEDY
jgi:hypothetical protein